MAHLVNKLSTVNINIISGHYRSCTCHAWPFVGLKLIGHAPASSCTAESVIPQWRMNLSAYLLTLAAQKATNSLRLPNASGQQRKHQRGICCWPKCILELLLTHFFHCFSLAGVILTRLAGSKPHWWSTIESGHMSFMFVSPALVLGQSFDPIHGGMCAVNAGTHWP